MPAKKPTSSNGVAARKATKPAAAPAVPATDAMPADGAVAKTTKARGTSVPPKSRTAANDLITPPSADIPTPMTNGVAAAASEVTDDQIREHAYHLWLSGEPGDPSHHWHTAERTLRARKS